MTHLLPLFLCALALPRASQETPLQFPSNDPRQEIRRLFQEVERTLQAIDVRLADAGAGEAPLESAGDSGIEKLLRDSQVDSRGATQKMDRILELALQMNSRKGGGGQNSGQSPLDQPRDGTPLDRESTPDAPQGKASEKPRPDAQPSGPQQEQRPGQNAPGKDPRQAGTDPTAHPEDSDPWGFLPVRTREVFRNQSTTDMPVQYRDWIDSYYRRLNAPRR